MNAEPAYLTDDLKLIARNVIRFVYYTNKYHLEKVMYPNDFQRLEERIKES